MRRQNEVKDEVLARAGRYRVVHPKREETDAPSPLDVKEVWVENRRYIVCRNPDEVCKDATDRKAIVASLREQLRQGDKTLVGNRATAVTWGRAAPAGSRSTKPRSPRTRVTTANGCCGPTPSWMPPRSRYSTSGCGWWRRGSGCASPCRGRDRSTTDVMRRFEATCFAHSWRWCCVRNWRRGWRDEDRTSSGPT